MATLQSALDRLQERSAPALQRLQASSQSLQDRATDLRARLGDSSASSDALARLRQAESERRFSPEAGLKLFSKFAPQSPGAAFGAGVLAYGVDAARRQEATIADARKALDDARAARQTELTEETFFQTAENQALAAEQALAQAEIGQAQDIFKTEADHARQAADIAARAYEGRQNRAVTRAQIASVDALRQAQAEAARARIPTEVERELDRKQKQANLAQTEANTAATLSNVLTQEQIADKRAMERRMREIALENAELEQARNQAEVQLTPEQQRTLNANQVEASDLQTQLAEYDAILKGGTLAASISAVTGKAGAAEQAQNIANYEAFDQQAQNFINAGQEVPEILLANRNASYAAAFGVPAPEIGFRTPAQIGAELDRTRRLSEVENVHADRQAEIIRREVNLLENAVTRGSTTAPDAMAQLQTLQDMLDQVPVAPYFGALTTSSAMEGTVTDIADRIARLRAVLQQ